MTLTSNCRGMALEIVQRSEAPNDAWRNLDSHYRAKARREIIRLWQEDNAENGSGNGNCDDVMETLRGVVAVESKTAGGAAD